MLPLVFCSLIHFHYLPSQKNASGSPPFLEFLFSPFWCRSTCTPQFSTPTHSSYYPSTLSITVIVWENTVFGTGSVFGGDRSCPIRCPANISARRIFVFSWLRDSVVGPRSACHNFHQTFRARHVLSLISSGSLLHVSITFSASASQNMLYVSSKNAAIVSKGRSSIFPRCGQDNSGILLQASSVTKHVCPPHGRSRRRPQPNL